MVKKKGNGKVKKMYIKQCPDCARSEFKSYGAFRQHLYDHTKNKISKPRAPGGPILCSFANCTHVPFPHKGNRIRHEKNCRFRPNEEASVVMDVEEIGEEDNQPLIVIPEAEKKDDDNLHQKYCQHKPCTDYASMEDKCFGCKSGNSKCGYKNCRNLQNVIVSGGFMNPETDPTQEDREIWGIGPGMILPTKVAKDIIRNCKEEFCKIIQEEEDALNLYKTNGQCGGHVIWKRVDTDVYLCVQCSTSIFDRHWICPDCLKSWCINCHKDGKETVTLEKSKLCIETRRIHRFNEFRLAQLSPANYVQDLKTELDNLLIDIPEQEVLHDQNHLDAIAKFKRRLTIGEPYVFENIDFNSEITPASLHDSVPDNCPIYNVLCDGEELPDVSIRQFWDGFENYACRVRQRDGTPYVLKLKDFCSKDDELNTVHPQHLDLFMKKLPIQQYIRDGDYNLAALLPPSFKPPELGPKFYVAYAHPETNKDLATRKLHIDVSDAVNINVFVSVPPDWPREYHEGVMKIMEDWGFDNHKTMERLKSGAMPAALWLIFRPSDSQKMDEILSNGKDEHPIHSGTMDITEKELDLLVEHNIPFMSCVQFQGDAVVIPAGAPYQVMNLGDCINMAEYFVSPENLGQSLRIARELPVEYENPEYKLQLKAIAYHSMKVALSSIRFSSL